VAGSLLALLSACGGGADPEASPDAEPDPPTSQTPESPTPTPTATPSEEPEPEPEPGTRIVLRESRFGPMLFDAGRQAIYLFDVETSDEPRCYDACAEAWPPVLTDGPPVAGAGLRPRLLGTTERRDGSQQLTYGGHPLYFYAHEGPGEVECHDVFLNGGNWYVVRADGTRAP